MSVIQGKAKKYDGTAIDYVSIFNWADGKCIAQVVPDAAGNWEYEYFVDLNIGITYVADGCEPITHGAYSIIASSDVPTDTILHYAFDGDATDLSSSALDGVVTGSVSFSQGRKPDTQAISINGGSVKTLGALPVDGDKLTISFWFNTTQNDLAVIFGTDPFSRPNMLSILSNSSSSKRMNIQDVPSTSDPYTNKRSAPIGKGVWEHYFATIDRSKEGDAEFDVYLNGDQVASSPDENGDLNGDFANLPVVIGKTHDERLPYIGLLQDFRVYNRVLTNDERIRLLNE